MKPLCYVLCFCCLVMPASAAPLKLCHEVVDFYPWTYGQSEGLDRYLLLQVAQRLKLEIEFRPLPWKRCQYEVRHGLSDGMLSAGFTRERHEYARFPLQPDGLADTAYRMSRDYYRVYRRAHSPMNWQDGRFSQVQVIGIGAGYNIIESLRQSGLKIDDSSHSTSELLRKLEAGFIDLAITLQGEANRVLKHTPVLALSIETLPQPYQTNDMYLALNRALCQRDPALCQTLWREIRLVRESQDYQRRLKQHGF